MPIIERDVVLQGKTEDGKDTLDFPITRLQNIEADASSQTYAKDTDYITIIDTTDGNQMKKIKVSDLFRIITDKIDLGTRIPEGADPDAVGEDGKPLYPKIDLSVLQNIDLEALDGLDLSAFNKDMGGLDLEKLKQLDLDKLKKASDCFGPVNLNVMQTAWTGTEAPYTQTIAVEGVTSGMNNLTLNPINIINKTERTKYEAAIGCLLPNADILDGQVVIKAHTLPKMDFVLVLKGVKV